MTNYLNEIQMLSPSRDYLLCRTQIMLSAFNKLFKEEQNKIDEEENKKNEGIKKEEENKKEGE